MQTSQVPVFSNKEEAYAWMRAQVNAPAVENVRLAFAKDLPALSQYDKAHENGHDNFFDKTVIINGNPALIGCNFRAA